MIDTEREFDYGGRIRDLRHQKRLTQLELGRKANVHPVTLSKLEIGERVPTMGTLTKLASAFGIGLDVMLREEYVVLGISREEAEARKKR
jgi:transcriptional regulator with XRE-family HTH domain